MPYFTYADKNIYYEETGSGPPLLLLHGNTASSKMFDLVVDLYKEDFTLVLIDFLGHGRSDRLEEFPADFWYDQAMQVIALLTFRNYGKVNLIGTSGGAIVALNVALERGDLIDKAIADSFEGEQSLDFVAKTIVDERRESKTQEASRMFWEYCHGDDWESVVDHDTDAVVRHDAVIKHFFHKDISQLTVPVMISGSLEDEYAGVFDMKKTYTALCNKIPDSTLHLFTDGGHPAMLSSAKEFAETAKQFLLGGR